ncbi:MAG: bifunctional methylenetetrahydrofolate dehydrogenase/methenyltetrahydrofolate cyclohydrolase FolD [Clostridia bacterium]|nr:bifunctional methylenetetrahydrofolate dehydrogenase/methenyltetrahydrofolate cyclohydrolase FolD [Clostridia bacterium]
MAERIDGKAIAAAVRARAAEDAAAFEKEYGRRPKLTVILVGEDPASQVYVRNKRRACEEAGILSETVLLPADTDEKTLLAEVARLNAEESTDGILVQLPLPAGIDEKRVIAAIAPETDVDCFHPVNVGKLFHPREATFLPCTPAGVMEMLRFTGIDPRGKRAVIVGRSDIVGKPLALLLLAADATVTVCHSKTRDLAALTREAEILVAAVGRAGFITADMVREGAVVIDVGINRTPDGKLCGDVDFASVEKKASYITPVPGGVGPMTVAMLLCNTLAAARARVFSGKQ